jgi:hypothetical protein
MKKIFIALLSVLMVAGYVYAAEEEASIFDFSGMINTRGSYISNGADVTVRPGEEEKAGDYMYYDMEFDATLKITPTDKSLIHINFEIHDENFTSSPTESNEKTGDDNIAFKRAFGSYNFDTGTSVDFGLMTGGTWATAFGDNANGYYRVKATQKTDFGVFVGLVEKNAEVGDDYYDDAGKYLADDPNSKPPYDAEKDDYDTYALAMVTKLGDDITIMPLLKYATVGVYEWDEDTDMTVMALDLGVTGSFGAIGFETEFVYADYSYDTDKDVGFTGAGEDKDYNAYGLYANAWMTMDAFKVGGLAAYGSFDKKAGAAGRGAGFGFGEDFGPGYWVMDWGRFGSTAKYEYYACSLFSLYGDYAVNDALSLYAALEYMMSNEEETFYDGATGYVLNASMSYKLADNVTYSVAGAYGEFTFDDWKDSDGVETDKLDADPFARIYHKIQIDF